MLPKIKNGERRCLFWEVKFNSFIYGSSLFLQAPRSSKQKEIKVSIENIRRCLTDEQHSSQIQGEYWAFQGRYRKY
jgi:hypothetical protein